MPVAHNQGADRSGSGESLAWLLMQPSFVSRKGESKSPRVKEQKNGRAEKGAELQEANGGHWGRLGADRDRGIAIDTDRNTDRERDIDRDRKHRNHW